MDPDFAASLLSQFETLPAAQPLPRRGCTWATVRIFCSSTFVDHVAERQVLENTVVPLLEQWGRARCIHITLIDLIWGVLADTRPRDTLATCFGELSECARVNGAPYFLYLGGARYGWAPSDADVGAELGAELGWLPGASVTAMEVVRGALRLRNPNALMCLRDEKFLATVPAPLLGGFCEAPGSAAAGRQGALLRVIQETTPPERLLRYCPVHGEPRSLAPFSEAVTAALQALIGAQYPPVDLPLPGSLANQSSQHNLVVDTLAAASAPRAALLKALLSAATGEGCGEGARRLVVLTGPSGRGKSSLMGQLAGSLRAQGHTVVAHFVGSVEKSNELGALARRISSEVQLAWGEVVDETALPADATEACALARSTLARAGGSAGALPVVVLVDAVNELAGSVERKFDWLCDTSGVRSMGAVVVILSCTPGEDLDLLLARVAGSAEGGSSSGGGCSVSGSGSGIGSGGGDSPLISGTTLAALPVVPLHRTAASAVEDVAAVVEVEALSRADRLSICAHHLAACGKKLSPQQMDAYTDNPGAASPLWQALAMSRLRRLAGFETLSDMIAALPPSLDALIGEELSAAEAAAGVHAVRGALLACVLAREGLTDGEALHLMPLLARVVAGVEAAEAAEAAGAAPGASEATVAAAVAAMVDAHFEAPCKGDALAALRLQWSLLATAMDPFLAPVAAGAPRVLRPSHGVVRAAILGRYGGGNAGRGVRAVRRAMAGYFESRHASVSTERRAVEAPWAWEQLREGPALAAALCGGEVMAHAWFACGDTGRWEAVRQWRVVGELLRDGREGGSGSGGSSGSPAEAEEEERADDCAIAAIAENGAALAAALFTGGQLSVPAFYLVRATFGLLLAFRRCPAAHDFLASCQAQLAAAAAAASTGEAAAEAAAAAAAAPCLAVALAWTRAATGQVLRERGEHAEAAEVLQRAVDGYAAAPGFAPDRAIACALLELGRVYGDLGDEAEDDAMLERAGGVFQRALAAFADAHGSAAGGNGGGGGGRGGRGGLGELGTASAARCPPRAPAKALLDEFSGACHAQVQDVDEADALNSLANVHYSRKQWGEALSLYQAAYARLVRTRGEWHPHTMRRGLWGIAIVQKAQGALAASIETHRRILAVFIRAKGRRHPDVADMHYNIGKVLEDMGDFAGSEASLRAALAIYVHTYGPRHKDTAWTWQDVGEAAEKGGRLTAALRAFQHAASIRLEKLGAEDERTVASQRALQRVQAALAKAPTQGEREEGGGGQ
jgi:tetratricopeptide (TPR) repeat protein